MSHVARRTLTLAAAALTLAAVATPAHAQGAKAKGRNVAKAAASRADAASPPKSAEAYLWAVRMAQWGRTSGSPLVLASAAQVMMDLGMRPLDAQPTHGKPAANVTPKPAKPAMTPEALLAEARAMAADNPQALAVIGQLEGRARGGTRGAEGGPKGARSRVNAKDTDMYRLRFVGGEEAIIALEGDGDTDLDCWVFDENGNEIDSDTDDTDTCLLRWTPKRTAAFRFVIRNHGDVYNEYEVVTN